MHARPAARADARDVWQGDADWSLNACPAGCSCGRDNASKAHKTLRLNACPAGCSCGRGDKFKDTDYEMVSMHARPAARADATPCETRGSSPRLNACPAGCSCGLPRCKSLWGMEPNGRFVGPRQKQSAGWSNGRGSDKWEVLACMAEPDFVEGMLVREFIPIEIGGENRGAARLDAAGGWARCARVGGSGCERRL